MSIVAIDIRKKPTCTVILKVPNRFVGLVVRHQRASDLGSIPAFKALVG